MANHFTAQIDLEIVMGTGFIPDDLAERRTVERRVSHQVQRELNGLLIDAEVRERIREALGVGDNFAQIERHGPAHHPARGRPDNIVVRPSY